jgi:hypothetical protein
MPFNLTAHTSAAGSAIDTTGATRREAQAPYKNGQADG